MTESSEDAATANRHDTTANDDATDGAEIRQYEVFEAYVLADINGDGIDELVNVWTDGSGKRILKWDDGRTDGGLRLFFSIAYFLPE